MFTTQRQIRVLHVDDEPDFADLTRTYLKLNDDRFIVETATSADEGLQRINDRPPDCVVSDYNMPGKDGIEFLQTVREEFSDLPFILFTGRGSEEVASEAISASVTDYLQKDTGTDQYTVLANRIRNAVDRRKAEQERNRQLEAAENAQEGISILNEDGRYIYVNQRFADIHGYDPEEMIGKQYKLAYRDDDIPEVQSEILPEVEQTGYWRGETISLRSDGVTVPVDHTLAMTDRGELVCTVRDISGKKERKQELQRTERRYQAILEDPNILAAVTDADGKLVEANQTALDYIDADKAEIVGDPFWDTPWWIEETRREIREKIEQAASGKYVEYEADLEQPDGTPYSVEAVIRPVTDNTGKVVSLIISARDVTRHKKQNQTLKEVSQRFELLAEAVSNALFLVAADYSEFYYCNSAAEDLYGVDYEELRDDPQVWRRHVHPDDMSRLEDTIEAQQYAGVDDVQREKFRIQHPSRGTRWLEMEIYPVEENGEIKRLAGVATDITERRECEQKLREKREFIQEALDALEDIFYVLDTDGNFRRWNDRLCEVTGYADDQIADTRVSEFFPDDDQERIGEEIKETLSTGSKIVEADFLTEGDDRIPYEFTVSRLTGADDKPSGLIGIGRNVSERIERDQELAAIRDRIEFVLKQTDAVIWEWNPDSDSITTYPDLCPVLNVTIDSVEAFRETIHPADQDKVDDTTQRVIETAEPDQVEYRTAESFEAEWIQTHIEPIIENDGSVSRLVGLTQDITERREREQKLEMAETLIQHAKECQFVVDVTDGEFPLRYANDHYKQIVGASPSETVTGQTPTELFGEASGQELLDRYTECVESRESVTYTSELPVPEEGAVYRTVLAPVVTDGEVTHIVGTAQDITDRMRRQEQLQRQNDRLEEFASVVSHDLRSPLRVADGRLDLLQEECESDHIDDIAQALDRMDTLIDDLLVLAREGNHVGDLEAVVLGDVIEDCWQTIAAPDAEIVATIDRTAQADRGRLQQLLENLLRNAVEHGGTDVTITIGETETGLYIEDDGSGIPEEDRDDIFDAGYSTSSEGTGFGLRIVKQVAEAHGWSIAVTGGEQGGTRFEITGVEFTDE